MLEKNEFSQLLMVGVEGERLSAFERLAFRRYPPGGVILFARNCKDLQKTKFLIAELQELSVAASGLPLIVAVDQEGGPVMRLKNGFPEYPGALTLGAVNHLSKTMETAQLLAQALIRLGINCNLAPVADLLQNSSRVLRGRCFGADPELVAKHVKVFIEGMQGRGVAACVKHFPGHGSVAEDSHKLLPVSDLSRSALEKHLKPFHSAVAAGVKLMMAAHIRFTAIDSRPVPFSTLFLQDVVRRELGFDGVLLSDDLDMAAVADRPLPEVMAAGIEAGLDMALWGRNMRPVADPEPIIADFCQVMKQNSQLPERLQAKMDRIRLLREGFNCNA